LRILLISWYFPPVNTIGSLRVGALARFLVGRGHDIGVVTGKNWGHPETLPLNIPLERLVYAKSLDVNAPPNFLQSALTGLTFRGNGSSTSAAAERAGLATAPSTAKKSVRRRVNEFYVHLTNLPDEEIGWLPWAYAACRRLCKTWQPDLVFASGPLFTALIVARLASTRLGVPWVAELRDRWADDPYDEPPRWRARLNQSLERSILQSCAGLVTVTEPWAEFYRRKYGKPVATIFNGYDPADFDTEEDTRVPSEHIVIGYAGSVYPGKRDPAPLFDALRLLGAQAERFRVVFCGTNPAHVKPLAARAGVLHLVEIRPPVPYKQSLEFQRQADVLLLMQWDDPREQGNCPGKLFEYLASLRPILILGLADGVPATIAHERKAGFCSTDPGKILTQLRAWLREKEEFGRISPLPAAAREGLSRDIQFEHLEGFLAQIVQRR